MEVTVYVLLGGMTSPIGYEFQMVRTNGTLNKAQYDGMD